MDRDLAELVASDAVPGGAGVAEEEGPGEVVGHQGSPPPPDGVPWAVGLGGV